MAVPVRPLLAIGLFTAGIGVTVAVPVAAAPPAAAAPATSGASTTATSAASRQMVRNSAKASPTGGYTGRFRIVEGDHISSAVVDLVDHTQVADIVRSLVCPRVGTDVEQEGCCPAAPRRRAPSSIIGARTTVTTVTTGSCNRTTAPSRFQPASRFSAHRVSAATKLTPSRSAKCRRSCLTPPPSPRHAPPAAAGARCASAPGHAARPRAASVVIGDRRP